MSNAAEALQEVGSEMLPLAVIGPETERRMSRTTLIELILELNPTRRVIGLTPLATRNCWRITITCRSPNCPEMARTLGFGAATSRAWPDSLKRRKLLHRLSLKIARLGINPGW